MSNIMLEAKRIITAHGYRSIRVAVSRVKAAVRNGDDTAVSEADRVLRCVEARLNSEHGAERRRS